MNARRTSHYPLFALFAAALVLLSACQPGVLATSEQPTAQPTATQVIEPTQTLVQPTQPSGASGDVTLDYSAVASDVTIEIVTAQPEGGDGIYLEAAPQYRRLTLQGYPNTESKFKPQIFVYAVGDLGKGNEASGKIPGELKTLLQTQQAGEQLPFLPVVFSSKQAMDAQVQFLDFKSGKGVRFLTQFNNGMSPINNMRLVYSFQGLTSDGNTYIAAVFPVTNPELPNTTTFNEGEAKAGQDYLDYISQTVSMLNQQPAAGFTPDLSKLDALIASIEVK